MKLRRNAFAWANAWFDRCPLLDWWKHTHALSSLLDKQLEPMWLNGKRITEREKCWRRQKFMEQLDRAHSRVFRGLSTSKLKPPIEKRAAIRKATEGK
jgi:hypothetical protein